MFDKVLSFLAPHYCCGCGLVGTVLCDSCKYDITNETKIECILCRRPANNSCLCSLCNQIVSYDRAWFVGLYDGAVKTLIQNYKFGRQIAVGRTLSELIIDVLPVLPKYTVIVPIPTIRRHVRQRGYDHSHLIAKNLAKNLALPYQKKLIRRTSTRQVGASASIREEQAKAAFAISGLIDENKIYLLIDDVMTTGATIKYAARVLKDAGAKNVWVAIIARQTLD